MIPTHDTASFDLGLQDLLKKYDVKLAEFLKSNHNDAGYLPSYRTPDVPATGDDRKRGRVALVDRRDGIMYDTGSEWRRLRNSDDVPCVLDYGAVGDGDSDDTSSLTRAITDSGSNGGGLIVPGGTYTVTKDIGYAVSNVGLYGHGGATIRFIPDGTSNIRGLISNQSPSSDRAISGTIAAGATSFTANSAGDTTDLVANDWLIVYMTDPNYADAVGIDFVQVSSVAGGTTVNVKRAFSEAFAPSGSQALQFQRMSYSGPIVENVELCGLNLELDASSLTAQCTLLSIYWAHHVRVHHNIFRVIPNSTLPSNFLAMFRSRDVQIHHNRFVVSGAGTTYGLFECAESQDVIVDANHFAADSSSSLKTSVQLNFGINRFCLSRNLIEDAGDFGILGYARPHNGIISENVIGLVSGQKKGISILGGENLSITNNILLGPTSAGGTGIQLVDDTVAAPDLVSSGNTVYGNKVGTAIAFTTPYDIVNTGDSDETYTQGTWTPVATNLTEVGGAATLTGRYIKIGRLVHYNIKVDPATNTSSVANSTTITLPTDPIAFGAGTVMATSDNVDNFGVGLIGDANVVYTPTWTAINQNVYVAGTYYTT